LEEVRTPLVEYRDLFTRSLGDTTEVVQKEMYTFPDAAGRQLALRPEGTAGVLRHVVATRPATADVRLFYGGPMFRRERPQAGRRRQFDQLGVELVCAPDPVADAEAIALQVDFLRRCGLKKFELRVNTRGEGGDLARVQEALRRELQPHLERLCGDCRRRYRTNVLRILDCKRDECRRVTAELPPLVEFMGEAARRYAERVHAILERMGIGFTVDPLLVRGLDYYEHTIWEVTHPGLGAQDAISGGGRYLVRMGGRDLRGVGFAVGMERLLLALQREGKSPEGGARTAVWLVGLGEEARIENLRLARELRASGIACLISLRPQSLKAQLRAAGKAGAGLAVIRGERELAEGTLRVKDLRTGEEWEEEAGTAARLIHSRLAHPPGQGP